MLSTAYADGRLTREEHDERLDQALHAKTFAELVPITSDLVRLGTPRPGSAPAPASDQRWAIDTSSPTEQPDTMIAVFGGATRRGKWRIRRTTNAYALFGGVDLDLREAVFESPVVEVSGFWCFGGMEIKVPAGIEVRDQTVGVFGGTDLHDLGEPVPGAPVLVIKGMSLFGGVTVRGPKPPRRGRRT